MADQSIILSEEFRKIYEKAPGIIAATNGPDHVFSYANESYKSLVGRADLVGKRVSDVLPEIQAQGVVDLLDRVFSTGEPFVGTKMPMDFNLSGEVYPTRRYVSFIYQPVREASGEVSGLFCEGYDATTEVIATERLVAIQDEFSHVARVNAMGMMAATLAHELNQPLAAICAYASASRRLVSQGRNVTAQLMDALQSIDEAALRAGSIIQTMRDHTKRGETTRAGFNLRSVVSESVKLVRAGRCSSGEEFEEEVPADLSVHGNRTQILQVLVNLILNACDASSEHRRNIILISAWRSGPSVIVSVKDTGQGLTAGSARDVFTWVETAKDGGTGLGLAICRSILDAHDGRIWLEDSRSTGSDFRFSVPVGPARHER